MKGPSEWLITNMGLYGVPVLVLMTCLGSLGIPFPATLVIIAAGAFTRQGIFDWRLAILACLLGAALADNSEYLLGRIGGRWSR